MYGELPLHSGHPVQFHIITSSEAFCEGVVLNLQLGDLEHQTSFLLMPHTLKCYGF